MSAFVDCQAGLSPGKRPRRLVSLRCRGIWLAACCAAGLLAGYAARAEAMLQLFNVNWEELIRKMPEIAEAGYTSLWLPPPTKANSGDSVGYDVCDPFDLGAKAQRGTIRTRYGTREELLRTVQTAHRFGLRVYFDNIMNHRGSDVPGYDANTPTNLYPGTVPGDFHLQTVSGGFYRNWANISDWNNVWQIQNRPLLGLLDFAHETPRNLNFGPTEGSQADKPVFIRHPDDPGYYPDPNLPAIAGPWRPFHGTNGVPVPEDVNAYLIRAVMWLLNETRCDGFRLDAVKHVPAQFFGDYDTATPNGYCGAIQTMFDYVHGYGNNALGNGYIEADDNRNSCFNAEAVRNDALIFGEHLGEPPGYDDYFKRGMRLLDNPLRNNLNSILGNPGASLSGYDQRDAGGFGAADRVMHAQSHDNGYAVRRELQNAFYFFREGIPLIYSDGYNQAGGADPFPRIAYAPYLGQFNDNKMPDLAWLHGQLARGGTRPRWSDSDVVAFERYEYREAGTAADQTVVLFAMNDNYGSPGDISFDDGVAQASADTYYGCFPVQNSRGQGLVVGFPPGSVLAQLADGPGRERACWKLLVRLATLSREEAEASKDDPNPVNRKVYVGGQALAPGGGAIELKIPSGGYVAYAYQWPEASPASLRDVITFRQGGIEVPRITVLRQDGLDGDAQFNPLYPFKMRGSVDQGGGIIRGQNLSNRIYAIDIPVVTNAPFDIRVRTDASAVNVLARLDGGLDLNSHMGLGPTTGFDRRDNKPGHSYDVFLGYEQLTFQYRRGPEKFAAADVARNTVVSLGAETYRYTVGGGTGSASGGGGGLDIKTSTADWVYHDPAAPADTNAPTQRVPLNPAAGQTVLLYVKVGYQFQIDRGHVYYTTDGSDPEGSFGVGQGATQVVPLAWDHTQPEGGRVVDWWRATLPAQPDATTVKHKIAFHKGSTVNPISDADPAKRYGVTQLAVTGFDPQTALVWLHNNLNTNQTRTGLEEGYHIVRARAFLPRDGKSSVFNPFLQTFYYDAQPPDGAIAYPTPGDTVRSTQYGVVVRADASTVEVEYNISDSSAANDDTTTGQNNGNGLSNGLPVWARASAVPPDPGVSQQYPALPREFRFNYLAVPASGTATLSIRLKEATTVLNTNRVGFLTRSINTLAPPQTLAVAYPSQDGQTLSLSQDAIYTLVFRFSESLTADVNHFLVRINGAVQPRFQPGGAPNYYFLDQTPSDGLSELRLDWSGMGPGQHVIEASFNGDGLALLASRVVNVLYSGVAVNIVNPPAADEQGHAPVSIPCFSNLPPQARFYDIVIETTPAVTNVRVSFTPPTNAFSGGPAVRKDPFSGNALRWHFPWTNLVPGLFTVRADALGGGSNSTLRGVQVALLSPSGYTLVEPVRAGSTFLFTIEALNGVTYAVEYADTLTNSHWLALTNFVGSGWPQVISNSVPGVPQRFYRFRTL